MILPLKFTSAIVILVVMYRVAFLFTNKRERKSNASIDYCHSKPMNCRLTGYFY